MTGRTWLITGVNSGFGRELTTQLLDRVDVVVSNAGYGLFGAAEELSDAQVDHIIATNLTGSIELVHPARMAARIIESAEVEPAPLRLVLGSQALETTLATLLGRQRRP
jgi:NAD(P)-dependent dehydrogenase (short-subunit alcohol dehydrogenase family)